MEMEQTHTHTQFISKHKIPGGRGLHNFMTLKYVSMHACYVYGIVVELSHHPPVQ